MTCIYCNKPREDHGNKINLDIPFCLGKLDRFFSRKELGYLFKEDLWE